MHFHSKNSIVKEISGEHIDHHPFSAAFTLQTHPRLEGPASEPEPGITRKQQAMPVVTSSFELT